MFLVTNSCNKIQDSQVPNIPFRSPEYNLTTTGLGNAGTYFIPGIGYGGVIVFCALPYEEYYAFDATCSYEVNNSYLILKDQKFNIVLCPCSLNSFILTCTGCGSQFNVAYGAGNVIKGPAIAPLKPYRTSIYGNSLVVYNY
jgi:Rieske Fe-S protein